MSHSFDGTLQVRGSISISETPVGRPIPGVATDAPPLAIAGIVADDSTRLGLVGLRVSAFVIGSRRLDAERPVELELGEAVSSPEGAFRIVSDTGNNWGAVREALEHGPVPVQLRVTRENGETVHDGRYALATDGLIVDLPIVRRAGEVSRSQWAESAASIAAARIGRMPQLVQALSAPLPDGPFARWSEMDRLAALDELEREFLDPGGALAARVGQAPGFAALSAPGALDGYVAIAFERQPDDETRAALADYVGKARSFHSLQDVDWEIDVNLIAQGSISGAVSKFIDGYRLKPGVSQYIPWLPYGETDQTRYRDYLREIWISVGRLYEPVQGQKLTPDQAARQIATRFHQDFHQLDTVERPANEVCIDILTEILIAGVDSDWGFGRATASIPARGTKKAREYLDELIAFTGVSASELSLRYRIDFSRLDSVMSSRVQENISTLQAFFRDGFQATPDAFGATPDIHEEPIVPPPLQGRAPFFLWYDEWLRQQSPFWAENHFDFRRAFPVSFTEQSLAQAQNWLGATANPGEKADWQLIIDTIVGGMALQAAHAHYYNREYALADLKLDEAFSALWRALTSAAGRAYDIKAALADRKKWKVTRMSELDGKPPAYGSNFTVEFKYNVGGIDFGTRAATRDRCALRVYYWLLYVLPQARGDVALARGDYGRASFFTGQVTRFEMAVARESDTGGYRPHYLSSGSYQRLYHIGNRPYTANTSGKAVPSYPLGADDGSYYDTTTYNQLEQLQFDLLPRYLHPVELKAAKLRHANVLLEWADALYRTDEPSSIQRARELYKAVLYVHGATPPISAKGPRRGNNIGGLIWLDTPLFLKHTENPAVASQKARAMAGFYKISQGLNWYGETDDVVPVLRYRALKEVGDRFAALAKATQQDFVTYMGKMEAAMVDRMRLANLIQKGEIQIKVAHEQRKIAEHGVKVAEAQVAEVKKAIEAKQKEIEDSQDFFTQLGDFLGGMVGVFKGMPSEATGFMASGAKSTMASGAGAGAMAGLGVLGAYAAFVYAGYTSMSAMAEEYSSLQGQLRALTDKALPAAEAQVVARGREVTIAGYQRELASADFALARDLLTFEERRYLSQEFWAELSRLMVRLLRRYLELAARTAWLAERALAYELGREIDIVRFDYFPEALQGVTGADLLQADLAELEAIRVEGTARAVPVRVTVSLAAQFPLAFGQLKKRGRCAFATTEGWLRAMYPGTHGHRVRAVNAAIVQEGVVSPVRGVLVNEGISVLNPGEVGARGLVRPAEALPVSEFRLDRDLAVHGLPNESLFAFEGSGIETFWRLDLPAAGNAASLAGIGDVLVTFDLRAMYDPARHAAQMAAPPAPVSRWILLSAQRFAPVAVTAIAAGQAASVPFDITAIGLSNAELNRTVTNVALAFVSTTALDISVDVRAVSSGITANTPCTAGIAYSNNHPDPAALPQPPMALNALVGVSADQAFAVDVNPAANAGADLSGVRDVMLAIEYSATLV